MYFWSALRAIHRGSSTFKAIDEDEYVSMPIYNVGFIYPDLNINTPCQLLISNRKK